MAPLPAEEHAMTTVFAEGETDRALLACLLSDLRPGRELRIVASGGSDAARPLARKQLLLSRDPVALVIDSDTTDAERISQQQRDLEDYLRWGAQGTPFSVVQFVPHIEIIFFDHPVVLRRLLGADVDEHAVFAGKFAPKAVLERLVAGTEVGSPTEMLRRLTEQDLAELRRHETVDALRQFIWQSESAGERRSVRTA
jgi:hypothetical protein